MDRRYVHQDDLSAIGIDHARKRASELIRGSYNLYYREHTLSDGKVVFVLCRESMDYPYYLPEMKGVDTK